MLIFDILNKLPTILIFDILNLNSVQYLSLIFYTWTPHHTYLWYFKLELPTIFIFNILELESLPYLSLVF